MAAIKRRATSHWEGGGLEGKGQLNSMSGALVNLPYSFTSRFKNEDGKSGTNPEELIAAAHAGCFAMKLSFLLTDAGFVPRSLDAQSVVILDEGRINKIELNLDAVVDGISEEQFQKLATDAKENCPVSQLFNAEISLKAALKR